MNSLRTAPGFTLHSILPLKEEYLMQDVFLVLLHANRIPPHVVILIAGRVFTLTVKGATVDSEIESLIRLIRRGNIETVFVKLNVPPLFTLDQLREQIRKLILAYPRVEVGVATCLDPIKEFCGKIYDPEAGKVNFVYELLPKLEKSGVINASFHLYMDKFLYNGAYGISKYSMNDIFEGIRKANESL